LTPQQVYEDQVRLQKESDQKKESEQKKKSENQREAEKNEREKENQSSALERKLERKQKNFYAKVSEIKRAMFSNQPMIVLLYKEALLNTNELDHALPSSIASLLQEYEDVFPEETPHGLPPIRRIEHQIDFVPGATIPNRPAYRSNPEETKELQRQVSELLEKGHVRESMSPCAVPVLLVPKKDGTWRMCVDCRAINNITVKYRHPIPRLDDMLDELHGSCIFSDASQGAGHANHTHGNEAEFAQDPLSLPSGPITSGAEFGQDPLSLPSGPITRLRAKRFKEALNGLIQENGADSKKIKMGSNNNQGLVHFIKAVGEVN
jgi:hypothetical protein